MNLSRRSFFAAVAALAAPAPAVPAVVAKAKMSFMEWGHRAADPVLLDADDGLVLLFKTLNKHPDMTATEIIQLTKAI